MRLFAIFILISVVFVFSGSACAAELQEQNGEGESASIVIPVIMNNPDSGWILGFIYMKQSPDRDLFQGGLMYSEKDQMACFAGIDHYLNNRKYLLKSQIAYSDSPNNFFGIGNKEPDRTGEEYTSIAKRVSFSFLRRIKEDLYFGPYIAYDSFEVKDKTAGAQLANGNVCGSNGADLIGLGLNLSQNKLDDNNCPKLGYAYDLILICYDDTLGSSEEFTQFSAEFSKFYSLDKWGVVGINTQLLLSDGDVPFQMLPSLGNADIMRGLEPKKYCDSNFFAIQGEYRFPIYKRLNGVTFVALGDVADSVSNLKLDNYTYGFGIRFALDQNRTFKLRLDIGCGKDETVVYFGLQEAF